VHAHPQRVYLCRWTGYLHGVGFSRTWLRPLYGAVGAAALVPVGLVLSIALAATVGGGGVGGLRQLAGGPTQPAPDPVARALGPFAPRTQGGVPAVPRAPLTLAASPDGSLAPRVGTQRPSQRREQGRRRGTTPPRRPSPRRPAGSTPTAPPSPAPPDTTPPQKPPPSEPDPVGDTVRSVGKAADDVVRPLPVIGPPVADAVGTVIDLVSPPKPPQGSIAPLTGE